MSPVLECLDKRSALSKELFKRYNDLIAPKGRNDAVGEIQRHFAKSIAALTIV